MAANPKMDADPNAADVEPPPPEGAAVSGTGELTTGAVTATVMFWAKSFVAELLFNSAVRAVARVVFPKAPVSDSEAVATLFFAATILEVGMLIVNTEEIEPAVP